MTSPKPRIGFIGLGLMGQAYTRRLTGLGYGVTGFDIVGDLIAKAAGHGVSPAASPKDVATRSDVICFALSSASSLEEAVLGPDGILASGHSGKILLDHSTTPTDATRTLAARAAEAGMDWVDAPVSGGPPGAETGTLAVMVGGDEGPVGKVSGLLDDLGAWTHMGAVGAGQTTKMVNQIIVLSNFCILAEALSLAEAGGVDAAKIPDALGGGYAGSTMLQKLYPRMQARDFTPGAYPTIALKDLKMVGDLARSLNVPTPMSGQAETLFRLLVSKGHTDIDQSAVLKVFAPDEQL